MPQAGVADRVKPQVETIPRGDFSEQSVSPQQTPPQATSPYSAPVAPPPSDIPYQEAKKSIGKLTVVNQKGEVVLVGNHILKYFKK